MKEWWCGFKERGGEYCKEIYEGDSGANTLQSVRRDRTKRMIAFFVDLKAAFDSVNRTILWEAMKKREVREGLVRRCGNLYRETKTRVKVNRVLVENSGQRRESETGVSTEPGSL